MRIVWRGGNKHRFLYFLFSEDIKLFEILTKLIYYMNISKNFFEILGFIDELRLILNIKHFK